MESNLQYQALIERVLTHGTQISTRNSIVKRITGESLFFTRAPLVSVRKTAWKTALREMEWFLSGSNNIKDLHPSVHAWWAPWADETGAINNNYSNQLRDFVGRYGSTDQIEDLLVGVRDHPFSRRNVATTWNSSDMVSPNTPITNCHGTVIQVFGYPNNKIDLFMYQRSVDAVCGLPHNWIQYWAFFMWLAHRTGKKVGGFQWTGGDIHIYDAHTKLANEIINTSSFGVTSPDLLYTPTAPEFKADDFSLSDTYVPIISTKAEMIV